MPYGALSPTDYPSEIVTIRCDRCDRTGRYRRETLARGSGADAPLPSVLNEVTACERNERLSVVRCRAYYVELRERIGAVLASGNSAS